MSAEMATHTYSYGRPGVQVEVDPMLYQFIEDHVQDVRRHLVPALGILSTLGAAELVTAGIREGELFQQWKATDVISHRDVDKLRLMGRGCKGN